MIHGALTKYLIYLSCHTYTVMLFMYVCIYIIYYPWILHLVQEQSLHCILKRRLQNEKACR